MSKSYIKEEINVKKAAEDYHNGRFPSIRAAAAHYDAKYGRVKRRVRGIPSRSKRDVDLGALSHIQEATLEYWGRLLDQMGKRLTLQMLRSSTNFLRYRAWEEAGKEGDPPTPIGEHWAYHYLERHPNAYKRKEKP
jgi:hypothetical protein